MNWKPLIPLIKGLSVSHPCLGFWSKGNGTKAAFLNRATVRALKLKPGMHQAHIMVDAEARVLRIEFAEDGLWGINVRKDGNAAVHGLTTSLAMLKWPYGANVPASIVSGAVEVRWQNTKTVGAVVPSATAKNTPAPRQSVHAPQPREIPVGCKKLRLSTRKFWDGEMFEEGTEFAIDGWSSAGLARITANGQPRYVVKNDYTLVQ